jgi:CTP:molybdopterin cytidylyltransferase MocA
VAFDKICAIVLAAGLGSRIGMPKWQLKYNGFVEPDVYDLLKLTYGCNYQMNFLDVIASKLKVAGIAKIICVTRQKNDSIINFVNNVVNTHPQYGMFSSVYFGVNGITSCDRYMIIPVDHPYVSVNIIKIISEKSAQYPDKVIRPKFRGKTGHPIVIPYDLARQIELTNKDGGLRKFFIENNAEFLDIEVDDANILRNINELREYFVL